MNYKSWDSPVGQNCDSLSPGYHPLWLQMFLIGSTALYLHSSLDRKADFYFLKICYFVKSMFKSLQWPLRTLSVCPNHVVVLLIPATRPLCLPFFSQNGFSPDNCSCFSIHFLGFPPTNVTTPFPLPPLTPPPSLKCWGWTQWTHTCQASTLCL